MRNLKTHYQSSLWKLCLIALLGVMVSCSETEEAKDVSKKYEPNFSELPKMPEPEPESDDSSVESAARSSCTPDNPSGQQKYKIQDLSNFCCSSQDVNDASGLSITREIDDRTCSFNYDQVVVSGRNYGWYRIAANSNPYDNLQPRIERTSRAENSNGPGTKTTLNGIVRVFRVGDRTNGRAPTDRSDDAGTYVCQAKGKDTDGIGDPALNLILVKASSGTGSNQTKFKFYSEYLAFGRSSNLSDRDIYDFNFEINRGEPVQIIMTNEIGGTCSNKTHTVKVSLQNLVTGASTGTVTFNVPEPQKAIQTKIRFGAYRCKSGQADVRWRQGISLTGSSGSSCSSSSSNWDASRSLTQYHSKWASSTWYDDYNNYSPTYGGDRNNYSRWASGNFNANHYLGTSSNYWHTIRRAKVVFEAAYARNFDILYYDGSWKTAGTVRNNYSTTVKIEGMYATGYQFAVYCYDGPYNHKSIYEFELYDY